MRGLSYALIILGLCWLAIAGYDEYSGVTTKPWELGHRHRNSAYLYRIRVQKDRQPELFRQFNGTRWLFGSLALAGGCIAFLVAKTQEAQNG
jgi:hypothetical protein